MKQDSSYSWTDYGDDLVKAVMPWIVFASIALIIFIFALVIRFLKALCCKGKVKDRSDRIRNICVGFSVIVTFLAMGCCGYIIHYSDSAYQSYMQLQCTAGRIPYGLLNGNLNENWIGLAKAKSDLDYIIYILEEKYENMTEVLWEDTDWLTTDTTAFQSVLNTYYSNFSESTAESPDPYNSDSVKLFYIEDLGSPTNDGSYTFEINKEYLTRITPIDGYIYSFKQADIESIDQIDTVVDEINSADRSIQQFIDGNKEVNDNIKTWIRDNHGSAKTGWRSFTMTYVFIGWFICVGVLITVSAQALNKPKLAHGLCCYWICSGLLAVIGFVLSIGLLSIGITSNDSCGLIDSLLDPEGLKEYDVIVPDYIYDYMNVCLNEGGDLEIILQLNQTFEGYEELINQEEYIYNQLGISQQLADFSSMTENFAQVQKLKTYTDVVDEDDQQTPEYNLQELNKFSDNSISGNYMGNCTTKLYDQWVFQDSSCGTKPVVSSGDPSKYLGQAACLVIEYWNDQTVSARYLKYLDCTLNNGLGNYLENIQAYQSSLNDFQRSVDILASQLQEGLTKVNNSISTSVNHLVDQRDSIHKYFFDHDQLGIVYDNVFGKYGLLKALNCKFVRSYLKTVKKSMCDNTRESIYQVFIFVFVLSFLFILLEFTNLYLSRALLKPEERESLDR